MKYFFKPSIIGILFVALFFGNCSEPKKKQETTKSVVKSEPEPAGLTDEQTTFIKERFQQYAEVKAKFDKTKQLVAFKSSQYKPLLRLAEYLYFLLERGQGALLFVFKALAEG